MRAAVMPGDGKWSLRDFPVPAVPEGGALLRVEATGVCHSDIDHLHGLVRTPYGGAYPSIAGHEIVGRIDAISDAARARWGVNAGQRVAVRESVPLPAGIPADELTVREPLAIAVRWATAVKPGDSVAILGPGHLGLATIVAARAAGAERIFVTGTASDALRLDAARELGAEEAIDVTAVDPVERVRELTGDGLLGDSFPLDRLGEALDLAARRHPDRDSIRVALRLTD